MNFDSTRLQIVRINYMEQNKPYKISESAGTKYYCACGKSRNLPYCDGSHKGSAMQPYEVTIEADKTVSICGCGRSARMPFCDGAHKAAQ